MVKTFSSLFSIFACETPVEPYVRVALQVLQFPATKLDKIKNKISMDEMEEQSRNEFLKKKHREGHEGTLRKWKFNQCVGYRRSMGVQE